jgi:2-polyprenyl-3-methyl-5-hydroxy-6-metoxy-1,4-benzoquinol methylase
MITPDYQLPPRMDAKMRAIPMPDLSGLDVLDVGCDMGFWCRYALANGAARVIGLDRGREVHGQGFIDLASYCREEITDERSAFYRLNLGHQWHEFGQFDVVLLFSLYHHIYQAAGGDHAPIWFWLSRHTKPGSVVLWENPTSDSDSVVRMNVSVELRPSYDLHNIISAASDYFDSEYIGPAIHEPTRSVFKFTRKVTAVNALDATPQVGAGGATPAFNYADGRRIHEVNNALGFEPYPGSLNLQLEQDFDWNSGYYRTQILDVANRSQGLNSEWRARYARFYPLLLNKQSACAFRFEGEKYPKNFVELIADRRLRDGFTGKVRIYR